MSGTTLVTGATGFVGSWLCSELVAAGMPVRGVGRRPPAMPTPGVSYHQADLLDRTGMRSALAGVESVIHLAARAHLMRDPAADPLLEFRRVNVEGTRTLLEEAVRAGVSRVVFASTVKAVGEVTGAVPWTEDTPARPVDPYGQSKLEAEELVCAARDSHGLHAPILRLPAVYGPRMKGNVLRLFRLVDRGIPLPLAAVRNRRSMAFVGNVAAAALAVLRSPPAQRELFFVSDGQDLSTPELIRAIGRALGRPARLFPVPPGLFRAFTTAALQRLLGSLAVDSSKLIRMTGFVTPYRPEEGLRLTAEWFRGREGGRA